MSRFLTAVSPVVDRTLAAHPASTPLTDREVTDLTAIGNDLLAALAAAPTKLRIVRDEDDV